MNTVYHPLSQSSSIISILFGYKENEGKLKTLIISIFPFLGLFYFPLISRLPNSLVGSLNKNPTCRICVESIFLIMEAPENSEETVSNVRISFLSFFFSAKLEILNSQCLNPRLNPAICENLDFSLKF